MGVAAVLFFFFLYNAGVLALDKLVLARYSYSKYIRYACVLLAVVVPWPLMSHVMFMGTCLVALDGR